MIIDDLMTKSMYLFVILTMMGGASADLDNYTALKYIYNGTAINNTLINGDLDLCKLGRDNLDGIIIQGCRIEGNFNMSGIHLKSKADFSNTTFNGTVKFEADLFDDDAVFNETAFCSNVTFKNSKFANIHCKNSSFIGRKADFSNVSFSGSANFINAQFRGAVNFIDVQFHGATDFSGAQFLGATDFSNTQLVEAYFSKSIFYRKAVFFNVSFSGNAEFENAQFKEGTEFKKVNFLGSICSFSNAFFGRYISFHLVNSKGSMYFDNTKFIKKLEFFDSIISDKTYFSNAIFGFEVVFNNCTFNIIDFYNCTFENTALFSKNIFDDNLDFSQSEFEKDTSFKFSTFNGDAIFKNTNFKGNISFFSAKLKGMTDFRGASLSGPIANFSWVEFSGDTFMDNISFAKNSSLILDDSKIARLDIEWNQIKDHLEYDGSTYLALIKNFRELEKFEDADNCYFSYRWNKMIDPSRDRLLKFLDIISLLSCGYGVYLSITIVLGILMMLIFALWFLRFEWSLDAVLFSIIIFSQAPRSEKYSNMMKRHEYAVILEQLLGWCLMALFMVVLTKKLIIMS